MSVVGFDVGNDTSVVAAVKQRGIDVLLNEESSRENPSVVSFGDKQRFLGSSGAASAAMNPRSTISQIKRLLGRPYAAALPDLRRLPFTTSESPADGGILIHIRYLDHDFAFTPVQILAMLLSHLKGIAEKDLGVPVSDCVIGVPSYFTDPQRRAYLDAAYIAGLNPLRLLHDSAATALSYGIYKTDPAPTTVVFVDIGHCDTQVSVVTFEPGHMRVLSHAFDSDLGGRDFDDVLFDYFAAQFREQYQIDVSSNARASVRLRVACEKLKKVLSANAEAPINIECLMDEKDVKGFIKREEFERLSEALLERVVVPCKKALDDAGLSLDRVHSVELVGSGSRIPAVMRVLAHYFRKDPSRTLNASECVARGCALQCAMLSPVFRVREYEVQDSFPFSIVISSNEGPMSTASSNTLFHKGQLIPSSKMLTFHRSDTFCLESMYADPSELATGAIQHISSFTVGPFQASQGKKTKVKVKIRLNLHGIVSVESASVIEEDSNDSLSRDTSRSDMGSRDHNFSSSGQFDTRANTVEHESFAHTSGSASSVDRTKKPVASRRHDVPVSETHRGMTKANLFEAQEQERKLSNQDKLMEETKNKRNALEAYVYEIRNQLFERYRSFASDSEREGISSNLQQTEEWLYEEGDDETEGVYTRKLEELKKLVDPIENRFKDKEARADAARELLKCIVDHRVSVKSVATYERDAVLNECNKAEKWLLEKSQQQELLPKNVDPVLWSQDIRRRTEALDTACKNIMRHKSSTTRGEDARGSDHSNNSDNMQSD